MDKKKTIANALIILGALGVVLVCFWDIITRKAVNDISGPKSIAAIAISVILIVLGIVMLKKKPKQSKQK